jgi:hypothetical protein
MEVDQFQLDVRDILDTILENKTVRELCVYNPEILEQITQKVVDFIRKRVHTPPLGAGLLIALQIELIEEKKKNGISGKKSLRA